MDIDFDGGTLLVIALIVLLAFGLLALWSAHGPEIIAQLDAAFSSVDSAAQQAAISESSCPTEIVLLPDGVLLDPDIPADLSSYLAIINQKYGAVIDYSGSHGYTKHKEQAKTVRNCLNNGGNMANLEEPNFGYWIRLCQVDDLRVGLQVLVRSGARWKEITAYILSKDTTVREVVLDMLDAGSILHWALAEVKESLP